MPKRFSVVIPTHDRCDSLKALVESLLSQDYPPEGFEVIVVDDGSVDGTRAYLGTISGQTTRITTIRLGGNRGVSHARNTGIAASGGEIIVTLDDDCEPDGGLLKTLDEAYGSNPEAMSIGVALVNANPGNIFSRFAHAFQVYAINTGFRPQKSLAAMMGCFDPRAGLSRVHGCLGCNNSFRREALDRVGLFNEEFPKAAGSEDIEFNVRFNGFYPMFCTDRTYVKHDYVKGFGSLLRQFLNYGRGGGVFKKTAGADVAGMSLPRSVAHQLMFIWAISRHTSKTPLELFPFLLISAAAHSSMLLGQSPLAGGGR
jgi:glycosyltransferase involved in cell wall biosynthesis